jgi:hypothetical protein
MSGQVFPACVPGCFPDFPGYVPGFPARAAVGAGAPRTSLAVPVRGRVDELSEGAE